MNYKYRMAGVSHVLTEPEHTFCQEEFKKGRTVIAIRNGTIGINMATVSWNPTDEPTEEQEKRRGTQFTLDKPRTRGDSNPGVIAESSCRFRAKMSWPHPDHCPCKGKLKL